MLSTKSSYQTFNTRIFGSLNIKTLNIYKVSTVQLNNVRPNCLRHNVLKSNILRPYVTESNPNNKIINWDLCYSKIKKYFNDKMIYLKDKSSIPNKGFHCFGFKYKTLPSDYPMNEINKSYKELKANYPEIKDPSKDMIFYRRLLIDSYNNHMDSSHIYGFLEFFNLIVTTIGVGMICDLNLSNLWLLPIGYSHIYLWQKIMYHSNILKQLEQKIILTESTLEDQYNFQHFNSKFYSDNAVYKVTKK